MFFVILVNLIFKEDLPKNILVLVSVFFYVHD